MDDLDEITGKMKQELNAEENKKISNLKNKLSQLHNKNLVKVNHSIMELVCAKYLIQNGFEVELERTLDGVSCDVYAVKGYGTLIVEVETGFVPPEHALDPQLYLSTRVASKITRYSGFANKFCLATPPQYIMQVPMVLAKPPRFRTEDDVTALKRICDLYYTNPPITLEEIRNARLHSVYTLNVDMATVKEWELNEYMGKAALWSL